MASIVCGALHIFCWVNSCWVQEELRNGGTKPLDQSVKVKDGGFYIEFPYLATTQNVQYLCQTQDEGFLAQKSPTATPLYRFTREEEQLSTTGISSFCQNNEGDTSACSVFVTLLKACADQRDLLGGILLHADITRHRLLGSNPIMGGAVVNMYAKCGALSKAQEVFDGLSARTVVTWNALIAGYAQNEHGHRALICFERMQLEGIFPDAITVVCVLNACGSVRAIDKGQGLHAFIIKEGLLDLNVVVGNALVDMYARCQMLLKAQSVFSELPFPNEVSWTTLITGFVHHGEGDKALSFFEMMKMQGFSMNMATCLCILKACAIKKALHKGQKIHAALVKDGSLRSNMVVGTALVDMYAKCGALKEAENIFHELPMQDVVSWGALLDGYAQHTEGEEALQCFEKMQEGGFSPDGSTFVCILQASGSVGAAHKGLEVHADIAGEGWFDNNMGVANSLVDMYAKCGMLVEAQDVFDELLVHDVITWNALIAGYAQLGAESVVSSLFDRMIREGTEPDFVTYLILLNACSHRGLLSEGQAQFERMVADYCVGPSLEHLTCIVDLYCRAGQIDKAIELIKVMPVCADLSTMLAVLGACQNFGNIRLGSWALKHTSHLDRKHSAAYICISNIYAVFGKQEDPEEIEA